MKTFIFSIILIPSLAFAGQIYFVYKASMTQTEFDSLVDLDHNSDNDMTKVRSLVPAANTNYYVLEIDTSTPAENLVLRNLKQDGKILFIGRRWSETTFNSRTGMTETLTHIKMKNNVPNEYYQPFYVEISTP